MQQLLTSKEGGNAALIGPLRAGSQNATDDDVADGLRAQPRMVLSNRLELRTCNRQEVRKPWIHA